MNDISVGGHWTELDAERSAGDSAEMELHIECVLKVSKGYIRSISR